jgi:type VI secretion system protein ImpM
MTAAFLFGKLPSHGDFVSRSLSAAEKAELDGWLSSEVAEARDRLGDEFDTLFDSAPPCRFAWDEPDGWMAGAMAASMDSAGRRFPLLVGRRLLVAEQAAAAAQNCEAAIYNAFEGGWSADRLFDSVEQAPEQTPEEAPAAGWWAVDETGASLGIARGRRPDALVLTMLTFNGNAP